MTYDLLITDSHVMTQNGMVEKNLVIEDGKIKLITNDSPDCDKKINGSGLVSIPGLIDTHVHYGVYSPIDQAAISESHAAAIGGVTTMMRMFRLKGSYKESLKKHLLASQNSHYIDYTLHASIFDDSQIDEMQYCTENKVISFKIYMNLGGDVGHVYMEMNPGEEKLISAEVNVTNELVEKIVKNAASLNCPVLVHAEDYQDCACGMKTQKEKNNDGLNAWSESRSPDFEAKSIQTICEYGRKYDCKIYFVHIGSKLALDKIKEEKQKGTKIFVETCPHYLTLSHETQDGYLAKVMPPIRTKNDIQSVWTALQNNEIDTIGTDHVANQLKLKLDGEDVWGALAGFPGIGTSLPILLNDGVNQNKITLEQFVKFTSYNAAQIFGMYPQKGTLAKNSDADVTMIDLKKEKKVTSELFGGFSDYIVYEGRNLKGWPVKTLVRGELVADNFEVIGKLGHGKHVSRTVVSK